MTRELMVIDTDCGVDDALAIMLALSFNKTWKIVAITCCGGNTSVENSGKNVLRVLEVCSADQIPVYRGCDRPLVFEPLPFTIYHGEDGLGNVAHEFSTGERFISEGHAANILVELAKQYKGKIHLAALGPLTNLALAHRLDPNFTVNLKSISFMGGNVYGEGNTTSAAEFNFYFDPEAAHIVLAEAKCPVTMVPWETTLRHPMSWDMFKAISLKESKLSKFVEAINRESAQRSCQKGRKGFLDCDLLAIATMVNPLSVKTTEVFPVSVETSGNHCRGQAVIERRLTDTSHRAKIRIVTRMDDLILNALRSRIV